MKIDPGEGWRWLTHGEVIKDGDEKLVRGEFVCSECIGSKCLALSYRRRKEPDPEEWVQLSPEEYGWHVLRGDGVDEVKERGMRTWEKVMGLAGKTVTYAADRHQHYECRCRRKDLPVKPPEQLSVPLKQWSTLVNQIKQWGADRKITENSTAIAQSRKTIEEVHELIEAAAKLEVSDEVYRKYGAYRHLTAGLDASKHELKDAIGDVFVTLCMVAGCADLDILECVAAAYDEIKDRRGYLRPDGVFVKETEAFNEA